MKMIGKSSFLIFLVAAACSPEKVCDTNMALKNKKVYITPYEQKYITLQGVNIRYIDEGTGPTILLIHGHQSRIEEFRDWTPKLIRDGYRVVIPDLPGFGFSDKPDIHYSLVYYKYILSHLLVKLDLNNVIVAGGSLGGNLSLGISREYPWFFDKVIAWSPAGVWPPHDLMAWGADTFMSGWLYKPMLYIQSGYWYSSDFERRDEFRARAIDFINHIDCPNFRKAAAQIAADQLRITHIGKGHRNKHPTLIMAGTEDHGLNLYEWAVKFADELPNGTLVVVDGAGHAIPAEKQEQFYQIFTDFLK